VQESAVAVHAVSRSTTFIEPAWRWMQLSENSSAELRPGPAHANGVTQIPRVRLNHRQEFHEVSITQPQTWCLSKLGRWHQMTIHFAEKADKRGILQKVLPNQKRT
jgi:hypothetical protein